MDLDPRNYKAGTTFMVKICHLDIDLADVLQSTASEVRAPNNTLSTGIPFIMWSYLELDLYLPRHVGLVLLQLWQLSWFDSVLRSSQENHEIGRFLSLIAHGSKSLKSSIGKWKTQDRVYLFSFFVDLAKDLPHLSAPLLIHKRRDNLTSPRKNKNIKHQTNPNANSPGNGNSISISISISIPHRVTC